MHLLNKILSGMANSVDTRLLQELSDWGLHCLYVPFCHKGWFVCVEVLRPSQPNGVMASAVSLPNHTFTGQA